MHKSIKILAVSILTSVVATVPVLGQQSSQWVHVVTTEDGNRIYFDLSSQVRQFDTGIKQNSFRTVTTSPEGRSLRGMRYQADCFKGTLALRAVERVNAQGAFIGQVPLESADRAPYVPAKDTVAAEIWRYACAQF